MNGAAAAKDDYASGQMNDAAAAKDDYAPGQMNGAAAANDDFVPDQMGNSDVTQLEDSDSVSADGFDKGRGKMGGDTAKSGQPNDSSGSFPGGGFQDGGQEMETKTVYLPVAVVVHTDTDTNRTFSILQAGDELEVLLMKDENQEEVITEIWMKGVGK